MVGKWHLGNHRCPGHGFEHWVALTKGHTTDFHDNEVFVDGAVERVVGQHIVEYFSDRAIDFLRDRDRERPFFLQVNYDGPYVLPPTVVGADPRNPFHERFAGRSFRPFPPIDDRLIRSVVAPFDFDLDPNEEYSLASAFNNLWWTVRIHNDQGTRENIAAQNALVDDAIGRVVDEVDEQGLGRRHAGRSSPPIRATRTGSEASGVIRRGPIRRSSTTSPTACRSSSGGPAPCQPSGSSTTWCPTSTCCRRSSTTSVSVARLPLHRPGAASNPCCVASRWTDGSTRCASSSRPPVRSEPVNTSTPSTSTAPVTPELYDLVADPEQWDERRRRSGVRRHGRGAARHGLTEFFDRYRDPRYDLWHGGTGQAMVSRYLTFKERYGPDWDVTLEVGPPYEG